MGHAWNQLIKHKVVCRFDMGLSYLLALRCVQRVPLHQSFCELSLRASGTLLNRSQRFTHKMRHWTLRASSSHPRTPYLYDPFSYPYKLPIYVPIFTILRFLNVSPLPWTHVNQHEDHCKYLENKKQLDVTYYFIVLLIGSTCFGHYYAHHQELATIMLITNIGRFVLGLL